MFAATCHFVSSSASVLQNIDVSVDLKLLGEHSPGFASPAAPSKLKVCHYN